ncbi:MAG: glycosyltransferase, partial [Pyrinomonadaceae bacterium]|nr:glycosyltransferase [Pyrinomonadaceae bacterium]
IDVLHARGHVPAAMATLVKRRIGAQIVFDIRGFMPEEYTDAGVWPAGGYLYRGTKLAEKRLFVAADAFVVLTERARNILFPGYTDADSSGRPVEVIPCCVDPKRFQLFENISREDVRRELNLTNRRVIVYVGALGGWYLTNEMAEFLATAHKQDATTFSLILTQSQPETIVQRLNELGISQTDYLVKEVAPKDVPRYLKAADVAISFIKPCYSKLSSSPTKIAEYLASGLPVISTAGIGDLDEIIKGDKVGVVIEQCTEVAYRRALDEVDALRREGNLAERCRASARRRFDLEKVGGERYRRLYRRLLEFAS